MRPSARIEVNGLEITTRLINPDDTRQSVLESLTVTDEAGLKSDSLDITIDDRDRFASAAKGDEVKVWLGYEPAPLYMGRFLVESVSKSGPRRRMTISAKAAEFTGPIRAAKVRSHHGKTLGEIATAIAAEHGLKHVIAPEVAALVIEHMDQQTESDLAFLQRLATRSGAVFKVADGNLLLTKRGSKTLPSGEANVSTTIRPADVASWEWESGGRTDYKAVACTYRDDATGERKTAVAGDPASTSKHRDRRLYGSKAEAEVAAKAQLDDCARGKVSARIETSLGRPEVFAECEVVLEGFDYEVDGAYRVKSVRHTLDGGGLRSSITLEIGESADPD
jgi:phage protein D